MGGTVITFSARTRASAAGASRRRALGNGSGNLEHHTAAVRGQSGWVGGTHTHTCSPSRQTSSRSALRSGDSLWCDARSKCHTPSLSSTGVLAHRPKSPWSGVVWKRSAPQHRSFPMMKPLAPPGPQHLLKILNGAIVRLIVGLQPGFGAREPRRPASYRRVLLSIKPRETQQQPPSAPAAPKRCQPQERQNREKQRLNERGESPCVATRVERSSSTQCATCADTRERLYAPRGSRREGKPT